MAYKMSLEEFEKHLIENSPNYEGSKAYQIKQNGQNLKEYLDNKNTMDLRNIYNTPDSTDSVLRIPSYNPMKRIKANIPVKNKTKYSLADNASSAFFGFAHLSKPIAKAGLKKINEALPYIENTKANINNVVENVKNKDLKGTLKSAFETTKDIVLTPTDYMIDKSKEYVKKISDKILPENAKEYVNEMSNKFDLVGEDRFNTIKASDEELQQMIDEEYNKRTPNKMLAEVSGTVSDIGLEVSLNTLGVPTAITSGIIGGATAYGDTNNIPEIISSSARGAIFGAIADVGSTAGEKLFTKVLPNYGKKYITTILGDMVGKGTSMFTASEVSDRIALRIKKGTWDTTEEEEKSINQNACISSAIGVLLSPLGSISKVKKYNESFPTVRNTLNSDSYQEALKQLDDINDKLSRGDFGINQNVGKKWADREVAKILENVDDDAIENLQKYFNENAPSWYSGIEKIPNVESNIVSNNVNSSNVISNNTNTALSNIVNEMNVPINNSSNSIEQVVANNIVDTQNTLIEKINTITALNDNAKEILNEAIKQTTSEEMLAQYIPQVNEMLELQKIVDSEKKPIVLDGFKSSFIDYSKENIDNTIIDKALNLVNANNQDQEKSLITSENIKKYTEKDIELFVKTGNLVDGINGSYTDFIDKYYDKETGKAIIEKVHGKNQKIFIGRIQDKTAQILKYVINKVGKYNSIDSLNDANITISKDDVKHIYNHHGNENRKGQMSVTPENLAKYPDTVNNPDYIGISDHSKNGLPVVYLAKKINGYSVAAEIVNEKRKILRPTSYYVYKTDSQEFKDFLKNNKMEEVLSVELDDIKSPNMYVQNDTPVTSSINNIIPSNENYVNKTSEQSEIEPPKEKTEKELWNELLENSSENVKEVLKDKDLTIKQGRSNRKVISNDESIQVSNSGNIYPDGNKPSKDDFNKKGLENHFEKGDKRFVPIDKNDVSKGYKGETWIGNQWKDSEKVSNKDIKSNKLESPIDDNGKTTTIDFISENRKKEKVKLSELKDFLTQKFVNKGHYVDKLADETNNPELKYAFDKTLSTYGEANYSIGVAQTDNNGKEIGKSLIEIFKPAKKANLYKEFNDYLINRHNLDRQALGKNVYDESVTSEDSRKIIAMYEKQYPEFKEWAEDVYKFNRNELHNLVEEGFISKELEGYLHDIYGDYIPLHRDIIDIVNQSQDSKKTGAVNPIKSAKGGNQNILNIEDSMAENVLKNKKAIRRNQLGKLLAMSTGNKKVLEDYGVDTSVFSPDAVINISDNVGVQRVDGKYLYTVFVDGEIKQFKIDDNLFESLRADTLDMKIKNNKYANKILSPLEKVTKAQRDVLTTYSVGFALNNPIKDFQDGIFYSKFGVAKFISNYGKALNEIATKGKYYKEYMSLGGNSNSYFEYGKGIKKETKNPISRLLNKIQNINEVLETGPRLSEYISTIEAGGSKNEAMYNASDITTNFKRGGEYTKILNKYGANFLNASVQGLDKVIRSFTGHKTAKEWTRLLINIATLGVAPSVINYFIYKDDEDYQNLESYIKDEYYLIKSDDDGHFYRIPKGRVLSTISATTRRIIEGINGGEYDIKGLKQEVTNQLAPNNPIKDNVFSPIIQVANNKTWYGSNMVPNRLQNQLPKNQYDEKTDKFSLWLGENLNYSPIKINYLLDQYSGGIGDVILPVLTPRAENNIIKDKFTTDSVLKNKNVGIFYDNVDKYEKINNDITVSNEDKIKYSYLKNVSLEVGKIYTQKRNIQLDSALTDKEKQDLTRELQKEINMLTENANKRIKEPFNTETKWNMYVDGILSDKIRENDNSSQLQDALFCINNNLSTKKEYMDIYEKYKSAGYSFPTSKTLSKLKENNIKLSSYCEYEMNSKNIESDKDENGNTISNSLNAKKATCVMNLNIDDTQKNGLLTIISNTDYNANVNDLKKLNGDYLTYFQQSGKEVEGRISKREEYMMLVNANLPINQINEYYNNISSIEGKKDKYGNTISGTKKQAVFNYVNSLKLTVVQKEILLAKQYDSYAKNYQDDIFNYINSLKLTKEEKEKIYNSIFN